VFTSNPSLSDTDILSLLLTGKTAEEVAEAQGGIGTTELVSIATGGVQEEVEHQFEEITGFDRIQVDPYYSGSKAAGGVLITVSEKLLDDDLTVTYSVTPMDVSEQQTVLIEYLLHRNIYLVGRRDELGNVSGNIRFRFEYR
jgi:autotransporter translocation and assembly factor TamB